MVDLAFGCSLCTSALRYDVWVPSAMGCGALCMLMTACIRYVAMDGCGFGGCYVCILQNMQLLLSTEMAANAAVSHCCNCGEGV